ncbi:restriction endonuclease subunit S, partial [Streptococcus equi]
MTYIDEMIKELCPDGVEWKELGEVVDYEQPTKYIVKSKEYSDDYSIPVLTAGQTFILGYTNEVTGIYPASKEHPVIIFDDFTTARKWVDFEFKVKSSAMKLLSIKSDRQDDVSIRYVWHYLGTIKYTPEQHARQWIGTFSKFKIPLPPLEIQGEIVKILDKFTEHVTELTAELTAELTFRQKQYSYFRDKLLSFDDESMGGANDKVYTVQWKTLGEVVNFRRGSFPQPYTDMSFYGGEDAQPFVQVVDVADEGFRLNTKTKKTISQKAIPKSVFVPKGTVIVTLQGTLGRVAVTQYDAYVDRTLAIFDGYKQEVDKRYFAHQLKFIFDREKEFARGSTLKTITKQEFSNFKIPVPPLDIQRRIVQVLDNFDTVCNDLNIGLPKEIELHQKQYAYFRDKLLTFTAEGVYTDSTVQYRQDLIRLLTWVFGPIKVELGAV